MKPTHLTDIEVQQYALHMADISPASIEHVWHCESCQARAREYTLLFDAVAQQTRPAFDFDLPEFVMSQLVKPKASPVRQKLIVFCIWLVSAALLGTTVFLFGKPLLDLFSSSSPIVLYAAMAFAAALTIFLVMESYREFRDKMKKLNFN
jgi:hypothetical protein